MLRSTRFALAAVIVAAVLPLRVSQAQLTSFTFAGTGSFAVGTTQYASKAFTLTMTGDLANTVAGLPCGNVGDVPGAGYINGMSSAFSTEGLGTVNLSAASWLWGVPLDPTVTGFIAGTCQTPSSFVFQGMFAAPLSDVFTPGFTRSAGSLGVGGGVGTTAGRLRFSSVSALSLTTAAVTTVPEPSTYALMAAGLAGLFAVRRRRRTSR